MEPVSFVIPCLNEQRTLPIILQKINTIINDIPGSEVVVSDNGSTDDSIKIAKEFGARVVHCSTKGYGAALKNGILNAKHDIVIFADADNTYDFLESPKLLNKLSEGYDLVIGNRLKNVKKGAMPFLHRYLGTPILTGFINLLYGNKTNRIYDCNSGFRCFRKTAYNSWDIKSDGMEFASEMLVKALLKKSRLSHVPISLYPDEKNRLPHLKTWTDGMRHLLQIFMGAPKLFYKFGLGLQIISWLIIIIAIVKGPVLIGYASVFGLHSMMFALLGSVLGLNILMLGLLLSIKSDSKIKLYNYIINLKENRVFWYSVLFMILGALSFALIIYQWSVNGFRQLSLEKQTLLLITIGINFIQFVFMTITAHLIKRT